MAATITVPERYGAVLLIALGVIPLLAFTHGNIVGLQRKAAKIPYPNCYATHQEAKSSPAAYKFNCAQRAHAQFLENMPQTIILLLVAGLKYPQATALLGVGWVIGRVLYLYGYVYSGKEHGKGRAMGGGFWLCQLGLLGICIKMGWDLL